MRCALMMTGLSTILPSTATAAPFAFVAASNTRCAQLTSSVVGIYAACTVASCLGWIHNLPPKPKRLPRKVSACKTATSSIAVVTPSIGAAMPASREAKTNCERK